MQADKRRPLVAGNWKMHGNLAEARERALAVRAGANGLACELALVPPFLHVPLLAELLRDSPVAVGAQDVSEHASGAYTGEVSAGMLVDAGCRYVIVGHSERRALFGDTDAVVAAKFMAARAAGLVPVLCVGETLAEREAGATGNVVLRQLDAVLAVAGSAAVCAAVLAYEPVWAIGTGLTATPAQAQEVHALLRAHLARKDSQGAAAVRILYGGSVKAGNAGEIFAMPDVDGGLVGGASLDAREFLQICAQAR